MRNYVLGIIVNNKDLISIVISIIAVMIAYCSWKESKIIRIESGQAFLSISLIQISGKIYAILQNIVNTYAYDIEIKNTDDFVNGFEKISILQPGDKYGFLLINSSELSQYPEVVSFNVKYHDYYSKKHFIKKNFDFNLSDYVKYNIQYNDEFHYYDIKKNI